MYALLSWAQIAELRSFGTPPVSNAIELFEVRKRTDGFMLSGIKCHFPELGVRLGHAVTATIRAWEPTATSVEMKAYFDYLLSLPLPRVLVTQDLDDVPIGAWMGEVNSSVHRALDCVGYIPNGGVRDLDEC
ncbi:MAG: hypothetical protein ACUVX8_14520 [Candidatus Zipacnadales bacterium]